MKGQTKDGYQVNENWILKIAREAVENKGFAIYGDYDEYMWQEIHQGHLLPKHVRLFYLTIRETLVTNRWTSNWVNHETRFYAPRTKSLE